MKREKKKRSPNWEDLSFKDLMRMEKSFRIAYTKVLLEEAETGARITRKALRLAKKREKTGLRYVT